MVDLEKLKGFFEKDIFCRENGIVISEVTEAFARISVVIEERHLNASGAAQGGVIFTLADFAFAVHANSEGKRVVTQNASITYIRPAVTTRLDAVAKPIHRGKGTCLYEVDVFDDRGKTVAHATVNGYILGDNPELL